MIGWVRRALQRHRKELADRRALQRHRKELADRAAARLVDEPNADIGQLLARLDAVDRVLGALPVPRWRTLQVPAFIALVCVAAAGALWTIRVDALGLRTGIVLAVDATTVDLRVADEWEGSERIRLADGGVRIERAALTFSDPRQGFATLADDAWVDVRATSPAGRSTAAGPVRAPWSRRRRQRG